MSKDISEIYADQMQDLTENDYYKKIQRQLKDKFKDKEKKKDSTSASSEQSEKRVTEVKGGHKATQVATKMNTTDRATISSAKWSRDESGAFQLESNELDAGPSAIVKEDAKKIRRVLGIKIDYSDKLDRLQDQYMQSLIQSRSSNFFLSKFAQFKLGMLGQLLSRLGLTIDDLKKLKDKAIKGAIDENIKMMEESIYNGELVTLIKSKRQTKKSREMLKEMQTNLIKQMHLLGRENYWSKIKMLEERIRQVHKIKEEFSNERTALDYQLTMKGQEVILDESKQD